MAFSSRTLHAGQSLSNTTFRCRGLGRSGARSRAALTIRPCQNGSTLLSGDSVEVQLEKTAWNSRKLFASISIQAPVETVWGCLTDYEGLDKFIPSLVENTCLERRENGALLRQVGAVQMGVKFSATCVLECAEFVDGVPESFCSTSGDGSDGLLPYPKATLEGGPSKDITFVLVEGDFQAFRGVWRMQAEAGSGTRLSYSLYVMPMSWLPVRLIQSRIQQEVKSNLQAVKTHSEALHMSAA